MGLPVTKEKQKKLSSLGLLGFLSLLLFVLLLWSLASGSSALGFRDSFVILAERVPLLRALLEPSAMADRYRVIVFQIRLPRISLSVLVGASLALVGAVFQTIFRNPLADPHILGISSGAAFGASLAILWGITAEGLAIGAVGAFAFVFALLAVFFVYQLAGRGRGLGATLAMLLAGTAMSTFLSAMIALMMLFHEEALAKVYLWTLGSFNAASYAKVLWMALLFVPALITLMAHAKELNLLLAGEEAALSMGLETHRVRRRLIWVASLLIAAAVSVSGIIGFVGLIVPHVFRLLGFGDLRKLLPLAALGGACFMVFCDTVARTALAPLEVPVGIITAVFGVPYFLGLLWWKRQREGI